MSSGQRSVRPATTEDVPEIAALHRKTFGAASNLPPAELERTLLDVLFDGPWRREPSSSLVYQDGGDVIGFLGVFDRVMEMHGDPRPVGVISQLMADPDARAPQLPYMLLDRVFSGEHDLIVTDGANNAARRIWLASGGEEVASTGMRWLRVLRPGRYGGDILHRRLGVPRSVLLAARPLTASVDAAAARLPPNRFRGDAPGLHASPLDADTMHDNLPRFFEGRSLVPRYDRSSLEWILSRAAEKRSGGRLRKVALRDGSEQVVGWYLYYVHRGGTGNVLQVAALQSRQDEVLRHLFLEAWREGVVALKGRVDVPLLHTLSRHHCRFLYDGPWTLTYSEDPELRAAVHSGASWITGLECEAWMRFVGG